MEYTTGLPTAKFADLLIRLREEGVEGRPPSLGLRDSLRAALIYMRHNIPQAVIGEQLGVSQPTISRVIKAMTDAIARALKDVLLTAEEVPQGCDYVVDGALFPCWSWRNHRELWSGKHKATGMNVQILVLPDGRLVWASDPCPGSMHDVAAPGAFRAAGGNRSLRVDRRQGKGIPRKTRVAGDSHVVRPVPVDRGHRHCYDEHRHSVVIPGVGDNEHGATPRLLPPDGRVGRGPPQLAGSRLRRQFHASDSQSASSAR